MVDTNNVVVVVGRAVLEVDVTDLPVVDVDDVTGEMVVVFGSVVVVELDSVTVEGVVVMVDGGLPVVEVSIVVVEQ